MPESIPVEEATLDFAACVDRVVNRVEPLLLTRDGKVIAELRPVARGRPLRDLAGIFARLPRLGPDGAEAFERDIDEARSSVNHVPILDPWPDAD